MDRGYQNRQQNTQQNTQRNLPANYLQELKKGYFSEKKVIRKEFLITYTNSISLSFVNMTYTQIRSFFGAVRIVESAYHYAIERKSGGTSEEIAEAKLIANIQRLDGIVTYACARDRNAVPENFRIFLQNNIEACKTAKDVLEGLIPHFEAVLGYFRYNFPNQR